MPFTAAEYLENARLCAGSNRFAVGTFERNITLYRQQERALNLVYALVVSGDGESLRPARPRVAVIGGGAFGLTAAVAAAWVGCEVRLYERHELLLPFQRGCDTRWVNPRYYEWPAEGSESRYAGLPLMSWQAGTASEVADQLYRAFERHRVTSGRIRVFSAVRRLKIRTRNEGGGETLAITCRFGNGQDDWRADTVIYATGFGVEEDLESDTPSYWRNDNFAQTDPEFGTTAKKRYLVSGVGDGGLTDTARLKIVDFRHQKVFHELFGDASEDLLRRLRTLQKQWRENQTRASDWLYEEFDTIASGDLELGPFAAAIGRLRLRLRHDTIVSLNGSAESFRECLCLRNVSLSNALLAYLLFKIGAFTYRGGRLSKVGSRWRIVGEESKPVSPTTRVVVRHGTRRREPLSELELDEANDVLHARAIVGNTGERIYPPGWWSRHGADEPSGTKSVGYVAEFASPTTIMLATTFVSTLADVMTERLLRGPLNVDGRDSVPLFRMTLHRVIEIAGQKWFQQISPYRGLLSETQEGGEGRVFPVRAGIVGLALRSGLPIIFKRITEDLTGLRAATNFEELLASPIANHVDTILACPFFLRGDSGRQSGFAIFADSSERDFFNSDRLRSVYAACKGFIKNIEEALSKGAIRQISSESSGLLSKCAIDHNDPDALQVAGVSWDLSEFAEFKDQLIFDSLKSTDLDVSLTS